MGIPWKPSVCIASVGYISNHTDMVYIDMCPAVDWQANIITIAVILGSIICFHVLFVLVSSAKSRRYFKNDSEKKEKQIE
jgi:hypothetical protein